MIKCTMRLLLSVSKAYIYTHSYYSYTLQVKLDVDSIGSDGCLGKNSLCKVK